MLGYFVSIVPDITSLHFSPSAQASSSLRNGIKLLTILFSPWPAATDDKRHCRTFTFYPCAHTLTTGVYCTPYTSGSLDKFYTLIESLPNTIILVLLSDCNSDDCQNSRPRDKTDQFSVPKVQRVVRTVERGAEGEMESTVWVRERNRALLEKVGLVQGAKGEEVRCAVGARGVLVEC